ncbi:desulfoferrodoxin [Clostridium saccharobutylicum]|uniref:Desulfoferrodoxin n=1 Tax=Clostridium saccharobutylicum TaxID=169679 RepID=A0A1S8NI34_CLOSA|nr:desulfoferrodoxin [Clostridium saccharobutylicum]OOM16156.1 desulfoferrodoxin [Clostridium saccharobutylicum]
MVTFYRCETCGNIVELIKNGGGRLVCCGKEMTKLEPNTSDGAQEKHVPVVERKDGKIHVKIGSVEHPMTDEHYIEWIAVVTDKIIEKISLSPGEKPEAVFVDKGHGTVYEYCNLHGLWKTEI